MTDDDRPTPVRDDQILELLAAGLPQREVARRMGVSQSLVSRIRARSLDSNRLVKNAEIARALERAYDEAHRTIAARFAVRVSLVEGIARRLPRRRGDAD